jgi:tetratricopeptide (TPR) repeat protein
LILGNDYLGANDPMKAEAAFTRSLQLSEMVKKDPNTEALIARKISMVKAEQGKLDQAKALCKQAIRQHLTCGRANPLIAWDQFVLAQFEQHTNDTDEAAKWYRLASEGFERLSAPSSNSPDNSLTASGLVVSIEAVAKIESKRGNRTLARSLQERAAKVRAQHPNWAKSTNPNGTEFYAIWGYLPYPLEAIKTRSVSIFGSH